MDENCIFCKLANGVIPANSIYEDEDFNVILDAGPAAKGHALILPKKHYRNLYEIDPQVLAKAAQLHSAWSAMRRMCLARRGIMCFRIMNRRRDRRCFIIIST